MKRSLIFVLSLSLLMGCSGEASAKDNKPKTQVEVITDWESQGDYSEYREIRVNGRSCIENVFGEGRQGTGAGISCDWSSKQ